MQNAAKKGTEAVTDTGKSAADAVGNTGKSAADMVSNAATSTKETVKEVPGAVGGAATKAKDVVTGNENEG